MNRASHWLDLFSETIQATLNRNAHKQALEEMTLPAILLKLLEEFFEVVWEVVWQSLRRLFGLKPLWRRVEREAADLAVCCLALFVRARRQG